MNSTNPNEMMLDKAEQKPKTWVCWDINSCPVPDGYDARMVGQCIASALEKAGYSGPLTITAIGFLNFTLSRTPDVLRAISSTGIFLNHVMNNFRFILEELRRWRVENPPPATLMLISGANAYSDSIHREFYKLQRLGYTTLLAYPQQAHFPWDLRDWLWETLIKDAKDSGVTRRQALQEKCCEMGETAWICSTCTKDWSYFEEMYFPGYAEFFPLKGDGSFQGKSFEDFTTHLKSRDHALCELNKVCRPVSKKFMKIRNATTSKVKKQSKKRSIEEEEKEEVKVEEDEKEEEEEEEEEKDEDWERLTV